MSPAKTASAGRRKTWPLSMGVRRGAPMEVPTPNPEHPSPAIAAAGIGPFPSLPPTRPEAWVLGPGPRASTVGEAGRFKTSNAALRRCSPKPLRPHAPFAFNGARGSFGWLDCGVPRRAQRTGHRRAQEIRRDDVTRWRPARCSLSSRRRPPGGPSGRTSSSPPCLGIGVRLFRLRRVRR